MPLPDVTFCVVDLETTGGSPVHSRITEIGAVKYRSGEEIGTFRTFVNPECEIPPSITVLTGITQAMVATAPTIEELLPTLLEFVGDTVLVAHNARFDVGFLNAALVRDDRAELANTVIDTVPLARRLLRGHVPDCKLGTLAHRLRLPHKPSHRALDDALATGDLLHYLIEMAAGFGVVGLDDLATLTRLDNHPQAGKLRLTEDLPRSPGVYLFLGESGNVLYVGKASNVRQRVRSYFGTGETRRKVHAMLRQTHGVAHVATPDPLTAAVFEARLIARLLPPYNRAGTRSEKYRYLRVDREGERLKMVNTRLVTGRGTYIGPIATRSTATLVAEAIESVLPRFDRADAVSEPRTLDWVLDTLRDRPEEIAVVLDERMHALSAEQRFEDAGVVRDRLAAFTSAVTRQRANERLRRAGRLAVEVERTHYSLDHGVLVETRPDGALFAAVDLDTAPSEVLEMLAPPEPPVDLERPIPADVVDELTLIGRHLRAHDVVVHDQDGQRWVPGYDEAATN